MNKFDTLEKRPNNDTVIVCEGLTNADLRVLNVLPMSIKSLTDRYFPHLANARKLTLEPIDTKFATDMSLVIFLPLIENELASAQKSKKLQLR